MKNGIVMSGIMVIFFIGTRVFAGDSVSELYAAGNQQLSAQQYDQAIQTYSKTLELDPQFFQAHYNRGVTYLHKGDLSRALRDFSRTIELDPQFAQAYFYRGKIYGLAGTIDLAIADFNKTIELDPEYGEALYLRGKAYAAQGKLKLAEADFQKAQKLDPDLVAKDPVVKKILAPAPTIAVADPKDEDKLPLELIVIKAENYMEQRRYSAVIKTCAAGIASYPSEPILYFYRATAYKKIRNYAHAKSDLNRAIALNPREAKFYAMRGEVMGVFRKYAQAIADYTKALEFDKEKKQAEYYFLRAEHYLNNGETDNALNDYERCLAIDPRSQGAIAGRADCLIAKNDPAQALQEIDRLMSMNPFHARGLAVRAKIYLSQGKLQEAFDDCQKSLRMNLDKRFYMPHLLLARIYQSWGKTDLCRKSFLNGVAAGLVVTPEIRKEFSALDQKPASSEEQK